MMATPKTISISRAQAEAARLLVETADKWGEPIPAGIDYPERTARFEPFQAEHLALPFEERRAVVILRERSQIGERQSNQLFARAAQDFEKRVIGVDEASIRDH